LLYLIRVIRLIRRIRKRGIYLHENFHIWKKNNDTILTIQAGISDINLFNDKVLCVMKGQGRNYLQFDGGTRLQKSEAKYKS